VASNIAQGQAYPQRISKFSGPSARLELDTQLAIALDLSYLNASQYNGVDRERCQGLGLLNRLIDFLRKIKTNLACLETLKL
jgi:hypothetical protein